MKITIIAVGKIKEKYLKEGLAEYSKRLSKFCDLEIIEVSDEKAPEKLSKAQEIEVKKKEAEKISQKIKKDTTLIVLDIAGKKLSSEALANKFNSFFISGSSNITFIIGGSLGLDEDLIKRANFRFSMSDLTFPHQLVRLVLLEQVYRVFKILNGEPYHK